MSKSGTCKLSISTYNNVFTSYFLHDFKMYIRKNVAVHVQGFYVTHTHTHHVPLSLERTRQEAPAVFRY